MANRPSPRNRRRRIRRTAAQARELILDAAEAQLVERGPDAVRLVQLAGQVGMSHPAILHHFGSRDRLVRAVVERTARRIQTRILDALRGGLDQSGAVSLLEGLFRVLAEEGHARLLVWLYLTGRPGSDPIGYGARIREIAETVHALRRARGVDADLEDTRFAVLLAGLALFGDAIAGDPLRRGAGLGADRDVHARFLRWLARLLRDHLERPGHGSSPASAARSRKV